MKPIPAMIARRLVEAAADAYVRGEDYRPHKPVMKEVARVGAIKFMEPPEDYMDQLWGRCFTPDEAYLYGQLIEQLVRALETGDLPSRAYPLMMVNQGGTADFDHSYVFLDEFKAWSKKNRLLYPKNWHALVMAATEPQGEPIHIEGIAQPVQLREKATRKPRMPTRAMLDEWSTKFPYGENVAKHQACKDFATWLMAQGYFAKITERTLEKWFTWNERAWKLEPTAEALERGFENNGVESS